jgi:hypothetical protein
VGVTGYVLFRRARRKKNRAERVAQGLPATPEDFANGLINFYNMILPADTVDKQKQLKAARSMLELFTVTPPDGDAPFEQVDRQRAVTTIKRHLK